MATSKLDELLNFDTGRKKQNNKSGIDDLLSFNTKAKPQPKPKVQYSEPAGPPNPTMLQELKSNLINKQKKITGIMLDKNKNIFKRAAEGTWETLKIVPSPMKDLIKAPERVGLPQQVLFKGIEGKLDNTGALNNIGKKLRGHVTGTEVKDTTAFDLLGKAGWKEESNPNGKWNNPTTWNLKNTARNITGVAGELFLDPMNLALGAGEASKLGKLGKVEEVLSKVGDVAKITPKINKPITKILTKLTPKEVDAFEIKKLAPNWKDKVMLALKRETPERNFEDIMGKDAPKMIDKYLNPVHVNEAEAVRFKNAERSIVKELGIKYGSKEDELVQKFGEGKISIDELKKEVPKTWEKVVDTAKVFREKYDTLLNNINDVITKNGYQPIPKRENYFPHMAETESILKKFGMGLDSLPTDIAGLTADFKPGKNFFANALRRKGDKTKFSAIEGFDKYIEGASKLIYHTDDIKRLRGLEKNIRKEFAESNHLSNFVTDLTDYTNNLAGKKSMADRGLENIVGRNIYGFVDKVRQRVASNMVGGNISSAITNFIPLTQSLATTEKTSFVKGMVETMANVLKDDGFINKSHFLTRRFGSDKLSLNKTEKVVNELNKPFKLVDEFVSQTIVRSKYLEGLNKGLSKEAALKQADDWAARIMADRSTGATPTLFNSKTLAPLTQFQIEVNNQLSFMFKDMPRHLNKAKLTSSAIQLALYSYLFNNIYEKAIGRRPAFDPVGIIVKGKEDYSKLGASKATSNTAKRIIENIPFASTFTGGRLPISAGLPDLASLATGESKLSKELIKPLTYLALPTGGGQIKKTAEGINNLLKGGVFSKGKDGEYLKYPIENNTANKIKAPLFGTSSLKETRDYYDNNRRALSVGQTEKFKSEKLKGVGQEQLYKALLKKREIEKEIDKINADDTLTKQQKKQKTAPLHSQLKKEEFKWLENKK